jgi:hypothetical protein
VGAMLLTRAAPAPPAERAAAREWAAAAAPNTWPHTTTRW